MDVYGVTLVFGYGLFVVEFFFVFGENGLFGFRALSSSKIFDSSGVLEINRFAISCIFYKAVCFL
jgi:hypothetical protein